MSSSRQDIIPLEQVSSLDGLFRERVRRDPEGIAYRHFDADAKQWRETRWREAAMAVNRWQAALAAEGLGRGERVALSLRNSREWVWFDLAAQGLGLVDVPLYTDDRPDNVAYIIQDAGVKVLLVPDASYWRRLAPRLADDGPLRRVLLLNRGKGDAEETAADARVRLLADWLPDEAPVPAPRHGDGAALASIIYTSGTTGRPKGVMLSHRNMLSIARAALATADCFREDVFLSFLPLSHTLERTAGYYLPMMAGASVAYARSVAQLADDLQTVRPSMLISVPRIFEKVYARIRQQVAKKSPIQRRLFEWTVEIGWRLFEFRNGRCRFHLYMLLWPLLKVLVADKVLAKLGGRVRMALCGGAALGTPVARLFIGLGLPLLQGYGLTETSPVISVNLPNSNDPRGVGPPLPGIEVRVGRDDELLVKTPGLMMGYWRNEQATREVIDAEGWFHTGDQARVHNGHIYITGRIKDILVLSNGEKVPPGDMEGAISLDALFDQVMVIGEGRPFLSAILVLNGEMWPALAGRLGLDPALPESLEHASLHQEILSRVKALLKDFPGYARVRRAVLTTETWEVDNGFLTPTLKVRRNKVLQHFQGQVEALYEDRKAASGRRVA